jgi:hypothetical protein
MPRKSAPVKNTGGGGYTFADNVAAKFLVDMLSRGFPFGVDAGTPIRLDWEAKELGWHIDDLLLHLHSVAQGQRVMAAISVKSNAQLNSNGFSTSYVQDAWAQWRGESKNPFQRDRDLLGVGVGSLAITVKKEWQAIESQASLTDAPRLSLRLSTPNPQSNPIQRAIFASVISSALDLTPTPTPEEAAQLLARIRVVEWDDSFEGDVVNRCTALTVENTVPKGQKLWQRLQRIAKSNRPGGKLTLPELIEELRDQSSTSRTIPTTNPHGKRSSGCRRRIGARCVESSAPKFDSPSTNNRKKLRTNCRNQAQWRFWANPVLGNPRSSQRFWVNPKNTIESYGFE